MAYKIIYKTLLLSLHRKKTSLFQKKASFGPFTISFLFSIKRKKNRILPVLQRSKDNPKPWNRSLINRKRQSNAAEISLLDHNFFEGNKGFHFMKVFFLRSITFHWRTFTLAPNTICCRAIKLTWRCFYGCGAQ